MKNNKVLIVDDNALNRKVFQNIIGQVYQCEVAENGKEALEKIKKESFDIIILDIQMPMLDGINTLKIIKEEQLTFVPVIAVSAFANENDRDYFLSAGFDDFISKPVKPKQLLESLQKHILMSKSPGKLEKIESEIQSNTEILNPKVVLQLLKYNSIENIRLVYNDFIDETERLLSEIEYQLKYGEYSQIGEKLHIIKGNSGTIGALEIFYFTQSFEKNIKSGNFDNTVKDYIYLKSLFERFKTHCKSSVYLNP
ncbi:response regulator [Shivajiella indica]|uniref:Response regulator n=1 Tax=Shivajiella indica TaxID=872115 RepID=A0ABW5BCJ0_9BACT